MPVINDEKGMLNRDLLVALCLAFMVHAVVFFISPSRSNTLPRHIEEKKTIEISLSERIKPKQTFPKVRKKPERAIKVKKVARPKPQPKPKPKPKPKHQPKHKDEPKLKSQSKSQPRPNPKPVEVPSVPIKTTIMEHTALPESEEKEEIGREKKNAYEEEVKKDGAIVPKIASLEIKKVEGDHRPVLSYTAPSYLKNPKPRYPTMARKRGIEGLVLLRVEVLPDGRVGKLEVKRSSGYRILDNSALRTIVKWKFLPAIKDGTLVQAWINIPVRFELGRQ